MQPMGTARELLQSTRIATGEALITGGLTGSAVNGTPVASTEIYDPSSGKWRASAAMGVARGGHVAVPLCDGTVLVACGTTLNQTEVYEYGW